MKTEFEWDTAKAAANLKKHGVSFDTAILAFSDPFVFTYQDRIENGELRWQTLGFIDHQHLLLVAHTIEEENETEIIRIISAREANKNERKRYERECRSTDH